MESREAARRRLTLRGLLDSLDLLVLAPGRRELLRGEDDRHRDVVNRGVVGRLLDQLGVLVGLLGNLAQLAQCNSQRNLLQLFISNSNPWTSKPLCLTVTWFP